jgi:hypothetical protein
VKRYVRISANLDNDDWLTFRVEDNGIGIRDITAVLSPFVRERPDLASGDGLGLASVKNLAEQHGWLLNISSEPGLGTTVKLSIRTRDLRESSLTTSIGTISRCVSSFSIPAVSEHPVSHVVTIPPPPPLPNDLINNNYCRPTTSNTVPSDIPTSLVGGAYLYLSISLPVLARYV